MKPSIPDLSKFFACLLLPAWLSFPAKLSAQNTADTSLPATPRPSSWTVGGYLKDLQTIQFTDFNKKWTLDNLIHGRADLHWYAKDHWKVHLGVRTRFLYGESVKLYLQNEELLKSGNGYFDLDKTIAHGDSYLWHASIDRASVDYTWKKWEITAGRQRINWGLNLVWNPNDIFNAFSYFDFDYEERPGTDAIRAQYYINSTSSAELAYKPGKSPDETIAAGLYRFTAGSYDIQALAGWVNSDYAIGGGWSGVLGKAGFNGEATAFIPRHDFRLSQTVLSASAGVNYTFNNSLYLHGAYLFNSTGLLQGDSSQSNGLLENVSAKTLSPARHSLFAEAAYQFSPLIRGDLAGIADMTDGSFFLGPFCTFSLTNNLELLAGGQLFFGPANSLYGSYGWFLYLRFKWSF